MTFINVASKNLKKPDRSKAYNRVRIFKWAAVVAYIILILLYFSSIICELRWQEGLFNHVFKFKVACPKFLSAEAVFEAIGIIGFSNLFLGWLYANLDKEMLGLTYYRILHCISPWHSTLTFIHLGVNLACVLSSAVKLNESSLISFITVIIGFIYQWIIIYNLLLNTRKCEALASYIWHEKTPEGDSEKALIRLSKTLPPKDSPFFEEHLQCLCLMLKKCSEKSNSLKTVSEAWSLITANLSSSERLNILTDVVSDFFEMNYSEPQSQNNLSKCLCHIVSAYTLTIVHSPEQAIERNNAQHRFFRLYTDMQAVLQSNIYYADTEAKDLYFDLHNCINTNIYLIGWMLFRLKLADIKNFSHSVPTKNADCHIDAIIHTMFDPIKNNTAKIDKILITGKKLLEKKIERQGEITK